MSESKKDIRKMLKYLKDNKKKYLSKDNPNRITLKEYNNRIQLLKV